MSVGWAALLAASAAVFAIKLVGYLAPRRAVESPVVARIAGLLTVSLLAGLVAVQVAADPDRVRALAFDARVAGLCAAAVAVWRRAPFVLVVVIAAAVTAGVRWLVPGS